MWTAAVADQCIPYTGHFQNGTTEGISDTSPQDGAVSRLMAHSPAQTSLGPAKPCLDLPGARPAALLRPPWGPPSPAQTTPDLHGAPTDCTRIIIRCIHHHWKGSSRRITSTGSHWRPLKWLMLSGYTDQRVFCLHCIQNFVDRHLHAIMTMSHLKSSIKERKTERERERESRWMAMSNWSSEVVRGSYVVAHFVVCCCMYFALIWSTMLSGH